jgi:adenylate kinase
MLLLGPPGSGKGTQATALKGRWDLPHLSSGDLLRAHVKEETALGRQAKPFMERGELVPDALIIEMMAERLSQPDAAGGYVLDGFPRTVAQAEALDARLAELKQQLDAVISLHVPEAEILRRLSGRLTCSNPSCNAIYQVDTMPPKQAGVCDKCGSALIQRADEEPAVIQKRLAVYAQQTAPLLDYYRRTGRLHAVDGTIGVENVVKEIARLVASAGEGVGTAR